MLPIRREQRSANVHIYDYESNFEPFKQVYTADGHFDNPDSAHGAFVNLLNHCLKNNIIIHHIGDLIDVMQGRNDRRGSKSKVKEELNRADYFNGLVDSFVELLAPYAAILGSITYGNHETAVISKIEIDLLKMIIHRLQVEHGSPVMLGGYSGFIISRWTPPTKQNCVISTKVFYRHSGGSYGEVSKGVLGVGRMNGMVEGVDMIVSGDNHEKWLVYDGITTVDHKYNIINKEIPHVKIPTFKDEYKDGHGGYHVEKNRKYKPTGFVEVTYTPYRKKPHTSVLALDIGVSLLNLSRFE
jgi:hypothetical protein